MSAQKLFRRLLTRAFRTRSTPPIRKLHQRLGRHFEELEDRAVPALYTVNLLTDTNPGGIGI